MSEHVPSFLQAPSPLCHLLAWQMGVCSGSGRGWTGTMNTWLQRKCFATHGISALVSHFFNINMEQVWVHLSSKRFFQYFECPSIKLKSTTKPPFVAFVLAKQAWLELCLPHTDVLRCFRWYRYTVNISTWWRHRLAIQQIWLLVSSRRH